MKAKGISRSIVTIWLLLTICSSSVLAQYSLYEKGLDLYQKGKYQDAIAIFDDYFKKPMRDKKIDVDVYYYRALANYKRESYKDAVNDFQETILLNRENKGNIYWFMAKANTALGSNDEAISNYTNALKEITADNVARAKLYYERSIVYNKSGEIDASIADLNSGFTVNPANAEIKRALDQINVDMASTRTLKDKDGVKKDPAVTTPAGNSKPSGADKTGTATAKRNTSIEKKPDTELKPVIKPERNTTKAPEVVTRQAEVTPAVKTPVEQAVVTPAAAPALSPLAEMYKDERRFALVIGNSKYPKTVGVLKNPVNDATDIAKELRNSNFDVTLLTDATYGQMRANMLKFKEKVDAGDPDKTVALFYYAGHGLQHDDENYLVPIDANIEFEDDIARYCFPIQRMVLANMERSNSRMNIVILDACRNNPFPALNRSLGQEGLGEMKRARGSFIAYATAPGSVASDGDGKNGLYTQELLKAMRKTNTTIEQVFKEVRQNVLRQSGNKQNTWDSSNIVGDFYFRLQ